MQKLAFFLRPTVLVFFGLTIGQIVQAQAPKLSNSIIINSNQIRIDGPSSTQIEKSNITPRTEKPLSLFPVAPLNMETHSSKDDIPISSDAEKSAKYILHSPSPSQSKTLLKAGLVDPGAPDFVLPPLPMRATNVQPNAIPKIRWLLFQSSERSANTGQLTCLGWARSINLAKILEIEGPFHAAVASASVREDLSVGAFWNNAAEATIVPLAAKWDAPIWALAPADSPLNALSALYQFSKTTKGSANVAVSWEAEYLERFQAVWLDGLVKSGDLTSLQAFSWKQKIRKWSASDKSRVDVLEYTVEGEKLKNIQWKTMNLRMSGPTHGCPTS